MPLTCDLDDHSPAKYSHDACACKNSNSKVSGFKRQSGNKQTNRQTNRRTDGQMNTTERIYERCQLRGWSVIFHECWKDSMVDITD